MKSKILILAVIVVYCCNSPKKGDSEIHTVSLESLKPVRKIMPLSYFVEDCSLTLLETSEDAYVDPDLTTVTEKYIGVSPVRREIGIGKPYKLFDRSGKFLCVVGSVEEYPHLSISDDIIDDKNELIYLSFWGGRKIQVYHTSGLLAKEIVAPQNLCRPKMFLSGNILTVVHIPMNNPNKSHNGYKADKAIALQFDVNSGKLLKELAPPAHLVVQSFSDGAIVTTRNTPDKFDFFLHYYFTTSSYRDTLYYADMLNNKILPVFTMTYSLDEIPKNVQGSIKPNFFQLNKDLILTTFQDKGLVLTDMRSRKSSWVRAVNDYFGNIPISTEWWWGIFRNGYFVHNMKPEELIQVIETRLAEKSCTDTDRQTLEKILLTLEKGANNVVFIGKLKSEIKENLW